MGRKLSSVYEVLIQGLCSGLSGHDLYRHVISHCAVSSDKRICRASMLAMSDSRVADREALEAVYTIATDRRIRCPG